MIMYSRWLLYATCFFAFFIPQCMALELIISDSGRNHSFSSKLNIGDSFSVKGADGQPVGGTLAGTHFIEQFLVPMPSKIELEQMSTRQEDIWVKNLGGLLKNRVHIATTNGAEVFEIRLLQDTPLPANSTMLWQEPARIDRFAKMTYQAIGELVKDLQRQETLVHITAALADSGGGAFAGSIKSWQPYADTFRRVDFVDARAMHTDVRKVIDTLSPKRVRIINTYGLEAAPPLTIARSEIVNNLLTSRPGLTQYKLKSDLKYAGKPGATPWMNSLAGYKPYHVERLQKIDNKLVNQQFNRTVTGQDFRAPKHGWDPVNQDLHATKSLKQLGIIATSSYKEVVPKLSGSLEVRFAISREKTLPKKNDGFSMRTQIHKFSTPSIDYSRPQIKMPEFRIMKPINTADMFNKNKSWDNIGISRKLSIPQLRMPAFREMRTFNPTETFYKHRKAWNTIHMNQKLPMPSVANINAWDKSWQSGQNPNVFDTYRSSKTTPLRYQTRNTGSYSTLHTTQEMNQWGKELRESAAQDFKNYPIDTFKSIILPSWVGNLETSYNIWRSITKVPKNPSEAIDRLSPIASLGGPMMGPIIPFLKAYLVPVVEIFNSDINAQRRTFNTKISRQMPSAADIKTHDDYWTKGQYWNEPYYKSLPAEVKTIYLSDSTTTSSTTKSEMKLVESMVASQSNVTLQGPSPAFEQFKYDHPDNTSIDPLGIKQSFGTVVQIKPVTPEYKHLNSQNDAIMDIYQSLSIEDYDKNFGQSSIPKDMTPNKMPEFPGYDNWKLKAPEYPVFFSGGDPGDGGGGSINDSTTSAFSYKPLTFESDKYLPLSINKLSSNFGQPDIKGVMLSGAASLDEEAEAFGGGDVSLVFQDSAGVIDIGKLRRFVTSLWAAYLSVEGPGISIDPAEPKMDYQKVRYIGQVKNTYLGCVMRETDYLMKQWAIGTYRPNIEGFLTSDDISEILKKNKDRKRVTGRPSRFWLIPDGLAFTRSGNMLLLSGGRMTVQTEYLDDNPKGEKNEANEAFAQWFTKDYKLISAHYPIFQELFDYAQLVSLGTYLRENRVPMLKFLLANRELIITERSIDKVDKLKKKSDHEWYISISGGVELEATESVRDRKRYKTDESLKDAFNYAEKESNESGVFSDTVVFNSNATDYTVTSYQSLMLSGSPATGDIVQTDFAFWKEYEEVADKEKWRLVTPAMELIRYYNPNIKTRAQLGPGWHLLVPFRLEDNENSMPLTAGVLPSRIAMVNLLSGEREVMKVAIDKKTNGIKYVPLDKNAFARVLVPTSNGSWVLKDCLGATFSFDSEGDLTHLVLRPEKTISFKVGDKSYKRKIPGYIVKYKYDIKNINGIEQKMLVSVRQGSEIAQITRVIDNLSDKIASIQVQHVGQVRPIEILNYMYNEDDLLVKVLKKSGHATQIKYEDSDMRIIVMYQ